MTWADQSFSCAAVVILTDDSGEFDPTHAGESVRPMRTVPPRRAPVAVYSSRFESIMNRFRIGVTLAVVGVAFACSSTEPRTDREFRSRDLLTHQQIEDVRASNAYDVVQRLKSHWLQPRGRSQMPSAPGTPQFQENPVRVYMDGQRIGTVEQLRRIEITVIRRIRYYSPAEASARWGFNHGGGAIEVLTRSER